MQTNNARVNASYTERESPIRVQKLKRPIPLGSVNESNENY